MNITQTLNSLFSKKTQPLKQERVLTDSKPQERSAVLDVSSKTMSRIASFTLFFFLSQTFAQTLYAATEGLKGFQVHLQAPVNLASLPTFSLSATFSGSDDTTSGSSFGSTQNQPRTPTDPTTPASSTSSQAKQTVEQILYQSSLGDSPIDKIKGEKQHGRGLSTNIFREKNGFKVEVGHQNNLLLSAFIGFSGLVQITHSALTDSLSLSVKSYNIVLFHKIRSASLGHVTIDAEDMQVTGDWHADSLTAVTKRFTVKDKSTLFVHEKATLTSDVMITKGATLNAKNLTVEAFEIDNENGTLGGMDAATITLKKRPGSTFQNKDGKIGSGKWAVFDIEDGYAIKHLGILQGEDVTIRHKSSDAVLDLAQGVVQASKIVRLHGSTIKGRLSTDVGVQFKTPLLWLGAKDFDLLPQTAVNQTQVYLMGQKNFHLTHDYRTAQKFIVTEHNFITKDKAEARVKQPRVLSGKEFHIDAVVQAKSMDILTPSYTGVVGLEDGANSKRGELLTEEGHLDVIAHDFDLQKGTIAADSADFIVRETLKVGRLCHAPNYTMFGVHNAMRGERRERQGWIDGYGPYNIFRGDPWGRFREDPPNHVANHKRRYGFIYKQYQQGIPSDSAIFIRDVFKLRTGYGSYINGKVTVGSGEFNLGHVFIKTGSMWVNGDLLNNTTISCEPHLGLDHDHVVSDIPSLYIQGKLTGGTMKNHAGIIHVHEKSPDVQVTESSIVSAIMCQKVYLPQNFYTNKAAMQQVLMNLTHLPISYFDDRAMAQFGFYNLYGLYGHFIQGQNVFPAQTSFGDSVVLQEATHLSGHISAPTLLVTASPQGLVIGTKNPYYVPPKPAVAMFHMRDLHAVAGANLHMNQIPGVHLSNAFRFYFQERFFHKEDESQAFYDRVVN